MYQVEDVQHQELFKVYILDGEIIRPEFVWAYTKEEALLKVESDGYEIVDEKELN